MSYRRGGKGIYEQFVCAKKSHPEFIPTDHQTATMNYFLKSSYKGLLLYHKLGSGKTCTSIMIADQMLRRRRISKVYVLTPGSLRKGWINEYCGVCGYKPKVLTNFYVFVTYNYNIGDRLPDFDNSLVIIDEVHNLINGVKNMSKTPTAIYSKLMTSDCRILALSGTPIFNYVYEWPILGNLLKPGAFPKVIRGDQIDKSGFMDREFHVRPDGSLIIKSPTRLRRQLEGIVSYFPGTGVEFYPTVTKLPPFKVLMPLPQEENYWKAYLQEEKLSRPPSKKLMAKDRELYDLLKRLYIMARKNLMTRAAGNFYYPGRLKNAKDSLKKLGGWIDHDEIADRRLPREMSMKVTILLLNILLHPDQKHVVFTFFKEKSGIYLLHSLFKLCGVKSSTFSGDMNDSARSYTLRKFNSVQNRYGEKVKVLLVTGAGAEGITIKEARHMHILESSPRESKIQQAIGRIVRYKSHYDMPKNEQNVKIWRYWSIARREPITVTVNVVDSEGKEESVQTEITDKKTIDEILYDKGQKTLNEVSSFLKILQKVSVTEYEEPVENPDIPEIGAAE